MIAEAPGVPLVELGRLAEKGGLPASAMPDRKPEPWESCAPRPFVTIEAAHGVVEVWALGEDRFTVRSPGHAGVAVGFEETERVADALAQELG